MSRTLTALFDTRADAEAAQARLLAANIEASHVRLHDEASAGGASTMSGGDATGNAQANTGIWASIKHAFLPDEDRSVYEEGVRRGGTLLTTDVNDSQIDEAIRVLEDSAGIDLDQRQGDWRASGWAAPVGAAAGMATPPAIEREEGFERDRGVTRSPAAALGTTGTTSATASAGSTVPVYEEQLVVGKREVERGGARVRSYVVETPVREQVRLHEEHVEVERRPVNRELSANDGDVFRERTIELNESSEEAVVGKTTRLVEEVGLHKETGERVEEVSDTVRHTEIEVERLGEHGTDRLAAGTNPGGGTLR